MIRPGEVMRGNLSSLITTTNFTQEPDGRGGTSLIIGYDEIDDYMRRRMKALQMVWGVGNAQAIRGMLGSFGVGVREDEEKREVVVNGVEGGSEEWEQIVNTLVNAGFKGKL